MNDEELDALDYDEDAPTTQSGLQPLVPTFRSPTPERGSAAPVDAHLIVLVGSDVGRSYAIQGETLIGRASDAIVRSTSTDLSRRHALIRPTASGGYEIEDLESRNGTLVNGIPVQRKTLSFGDRIRIGCDLLLLFSEYDPMEDRLLQAQRLEAIGQLTSGVAHDFNNVLAAAVANVGFIRGLAGQGISLDESEIQECLGDVDSALARATDLVRQLLGLTRPEKQRDDIVDVATLVQDLGRLLQRTFAKSIALTVDVQAPLAMVGDGSQLHQLLMNLCLNARDAMPRGGALTLSAREVDVDPRMAARLPGIPLGRYVELSVADTGGGIPAAVRERIFDPFFSTKPSGSGLGLSTVYRIVKAHGGRIEVHSAAAQQGACFVVYLPASDGPVSAGRVAQSPPAVQTRPLRAGLILLVDDEPAFRKAATRLLESMGYPVKAVADGVEALEVFRRTPELFKVVLLDLEMPIMDGFDTFHALRQVDPAVKVLICSGRQPEARERALLAAGARGFLNKPFDVAELGRALSLALTPSA